VVKDERPFQTTHSPRFKSSRNTKWKWSGGCSKQLELHLLLRYTKRNDSVWRLIEKKNPPSPGEPGCKRCYSSKESSLQDMASKHSRLFFAFAFKSSALKVIRPKYYLLRISGINHIGKPSDVSVTKNGMLLVPHLAMKMTSLAVGEKISTSHFSHL